MTIPYNPYEFILGSTPNIPRGRFVYTSGTFKQLVQLSIDDAPGAPFDVIIGGTRSFQNNDNTLKLDDIDLGSRNSGFVSVKMKEGFQGLFFLTTENNDFFDDNALTGIRGDWTSENEIATEDLAGNWPTVWYQADTDGGLSRTMFGLDEGDYVSIDVDSESSRVAQMRVRIGGVDYYNNREINDETYLSMLWVRQWLPDYENTGFTPIDPEPDPDPIPTPTVECPVGFEDNGFGICVPIQEEQEGGGGNGDTDLTSEVSDGAVLILIAGVVGVVYLAVKL